MLWSGAAAVIGAALLSALAAFRYFTRRITALSADMERFSSSGFSELPAQLISQQPPAAADEIDRVRGRFHDLARGAHE